MALWLNLSTANPKLECTYKWFEVGKVDSSQWADISIKEYYGVVAADIFLLLLPGKKGSYTEFGVALASVPNVFVAGELSDFQETPEGDYPSIFLFLPTVKRIAYDGTYDDLLTAVQKGIDSCHASLR
jgi:hypothetical protein